jgi:hypothetical protein
MAAGEYAPLWRTIWISFRKQPGPLQAGYGLTAIWFVLLVTNLLRPGKWSELWGLTLNNWGDFVAGAFAPLAFLWLVVAVLLQKDELSLQRRELEHSVEALRQQGRETQALAEQTKISVEIAAKSLEQQRRREVEASLNGQIDAIALLVTTEGKPCLRRYEKGEAAITSLGIRRTCAPRYKSVERTTFSLLP